MTGSPPGASHHRTHLTNYWLIYKRPPPAFTFNCQRMTFSSGAADAMGRVSADNVRRDLNFGSEKQSSNTVLIAIFQFIQRLQKHWFYWRQDSGVRHRRFKLADVLVAEAKPFNAKLVRVLQIS